MPRPRGSGKFSFVSGLVFLAVFTTSIVTNLREVCPYQLLQGWLLFAAAILLAWGWNRIKNGRDDNTIGQNTINFVVGLVGATIALFTLVATAPACR